MLYFVLFLFGLCVGSFLNVVSLRYPGGVGGRSRCPHCLKTLQWFELIPLFSFSWQKGRCRSCLRKLSWQYPIVELLSGLIFIFVHSFIWLIIFELFLLLSIIDFRLYIIPDFINLSLAGLGILNPLFIVPHSFLGAYARMLDLPFLNSLNSIFAALVVLFFYGALIVLTRGRGLGWGDFKLIGAIGLIFGWPDALIISLLAFIIGAIFAIPLLLRGKKKMKDPVPFGPFIIAAATLVFFFGVQMADGYFKLFGLFV